MFKVNFGVVDYIICVLVLSISAVIGIYFGCFGSKQKSATEYMYGKGRRRAVPIGLSIYSSSVSAVLTIGAPVEIYAFGTQFMTFYIGSLLTALFAWYFVLPVFCGQLRIKTPYEYFELRFSYSVRILVTVIQILEMLFYIPAVLYAATVVFSEASNISITLCTTIIGGVCILYTLVGGFSAVVWSDAFQATLMLASCIFVLCRAVSNVGGFSEMWARADHGGRISFFDMDPNPFRRLSFWSTILGGFVGISGHNYCSASCMQRYMALKKEKSARISTIIGSSLFSLYGVLICFTGLAMYAQYHDCDPVKNGDVSGSNKLVPYFIAQTVQDFPGFLGIFNAGVLSAGLSTISAELISVSTLIYHCFIKRYWKNTNGEEEGAKIMKLIVLVYGIICLIIAPILDDAKYLISLILSISGITFGLKAGIMLLGTTFPKSNSVGAFCGVIAGAAVPVWIQIGSMLYSNSASETLPVSVANCAMYNITEIEPMKTMEPPLIYKLSFLYYSVSAAVITIIVSLLISYITGLNNVHEMDPHLFIPCVRPKVNQSRICEEEMLRKDDNCNENY